MLIKKRITLQPGVPFHFTSMSPAYKDGSLTLRQFSVSGERVEWVIELNSGALVEGRARGARDLPLWPESWITLAIPVKIHVRERGNAPDFIVAVPGSVKEKS